MVDKQTIAKERQEINSAIRSFFRLREYIEVETPILVRSPGMEPHLMPFETIVREPDGKEHRATLITSPEYSMKKLLGIGMQKIFTITKVFRNEEACGGLHNPEFSMLEWYQQGADYKACMNETEELIMGISNIKSQILNVMFDRRNIRNLFLQYIDFDLDVADHAALFNACQRHKINTSPDDTESDLFYRLFLTLVEPKLTGNVFVYDYPKYQASLSKLTPDGKYGERFELYMNGLEICNGFTELTDAKEQRIRFEEEAEERKRAGKTVHPIDEELLSLLSSLRNPTFGNALGIDRLHMVMTGRTKIEDVLLFPARKIFD